MALTSNKVVPLINTEKSDISNNISLEAAKTAVVLDSALEGRSPEVPEKDVTEAPALPVKDDLNISANPNRTKSVNIASTQKILKSKDGAISKRGGFPLYLWHKRSISLRASNNPYSLYDLRTFYNSKVVNIQGSKAAFEKSNAQLFDTIATATVDPSRVISYFKPEDNSTPRSLIDIKDIVSIEPKYNIKKEAFSIITKDKNELIFSTRSLEESKSWINEIKERMSHKPVDLSKNETYKANYQHLVGRKGFQNPVAVKKEASPVPKIEVEAIKNTKIEVLSDDKNNLVDNDEQPSVPRKSFSHEVMATLNSKLGKEEPKRVPIPVDAEPQSNPASANSTQIGTGTDLNFQTALSQPEAVGSTNLTNTEILLDEQAAVQSTVFENEVETKQIQQQAPKSIEVEEIKSDIDNHSGIPAEPLVLGNDSNKVVSEHQDASISSLKAKDEIAHKESEVKEEQLTDSPLKNEHIIETINKSISDVQGDEQPKNDSDSTTLPRTPESKDLAIIETDTIAINELAKTEEIKPIQDSVKEVSSNIEAIKEEAVSSNPDVDSQKLSEPLMEIEVVGDSKVSEYAPETPKKEGETPEVPVKQEEAPEVPVKQEEAPEVPVKQEEAPEVPVKQEKTPEVPVKQEKAPEVPKKEANNIKALKDHENLEVKKSLPNLKDGKGSVSSSKSKKKKKGKKH
ncbi:hypothetical protein K502DRAFT_325790 [Neoconidiobolus thromboides FSU 785]|nr:hypothetical protein K502DRAFT_325790 [Neoconidiobolus thromboides FSU 785]